MGTIISARRSYVAGRWVEGDEALPVENPADESHVADVSVTPLAETRRLARSWCSTLAVVR